MCTALVELLQFGKDINSISKCILSHIAFQYMQQLKTVKGVQDIECNEATSDSWFNKLRHSSWFQGVIMEDMSRFPKCPLSCVFSFHWVSSAEKVCH